MLGSERVNTTLPSATVHQVLPNRKGKRRPLLDTGASQGSGGIYSWRPMLLTCDIPLLPPVLEQGQCKAHSSPSPLLLSLTSEGSGCFLPPP